MFLHENPTVRGAWQAMGSQSRTQLSKWAHTRIGENRVGSVRQSLALLYPVILVKVNQTTTLNPAVLSSLCKPQRARTDWERRVQGENRHRQGTSSVQGQEVRSSCSSASPFNASSIFFLSLQDTRDLMLLPFGSLNTPILVAPSSLPTKTKTWKERSVTIEWCLYDYRNY